MTEQKEIQDLKKRLRDAERKNAALEQEVQRLNEKHQVEIQKLNRRIDYEVQYHVDVLRNRIASVLTSEFNELNELREENLADGLERHLFIKMERIFKKLRRENIEF